MTLQKTARGTTVSRPTTKVSSELDNLLKEQRIPFVVFESGKEVYAAISILLYLSPINKPYFLTEAIKMEEYPYYFFYRCNAEPKSVVALLDRFLEHHLSFCEHLLLSKIIIEV